MVNRVDVFVEVSDSNISLLKVFVQKLGVARDSFRYFNKRDFDVINNHIVTLLCYCQNEPVAYGHLDKDGDDVWLGVAVLPSFHGKGLGSNMVKKLVQIGIENDVKRIKLAADTQNHSAVRIYIKNGFTLEREDGLISFYELNLEK